MIHNTQLTATTCFDDRELFWDILKEPSTKGTFGENCTYLFIGDGATNQFTIGACAITSCCVDNINCYTGNGSAALTRSGAITSCGIFGGTVVFAPAPVAGALIEIRALLG